MMQNEMVRKVKGNNGNESQCVSVSHRFPCLAKMLAEADERGEKSELFF